MMRSLFSGISGLKNHQTRMDVIGNNISNVNTTGFKSSRVTFVDMLSQTQTGAASPKENIGGTNPKQIGLGSAVGSIDLMFQDGSVQSTGKNTDLCLSGNGLFVVNRGNERFYTRDGAFEFDAEGNYVLPGSGLYVQGWNGVDGVIDTTKATENIVVQVGKSMPATATSEVNYANNLNANIPMVTGITKSDGTAVTDSAVATEEEPLTITLSDGTSIIQTSGGYKVGNSMPVTTTVTMYDSLGATHQIPVYFIREGEVETDATTGETTVKSLDKWLVALAPGYSGTADSPTYVAKDAETTYEFIEENGTKTTVKMNAVEIQFQKTGQIVTKLSEGASGTAQTNGTAVMTLTSGAAGTEGVEPLPTGTSTEQQSVLINFLNLTQFAGNNTVNGTPNGNAAGTLKEVQIDTSGVITGVYTNGERVAEAQVAVAQFTNATGLTKTGNSLYQESNNSGAPNIKTVNDLGLTITPSALEMSNVDVANEFADMIITQRGFQSNSKIVTVGDEMLETVINMKR